MVITVHVQKSYNNFEIVIVFRAFPSLTVERRVIRHHGYLR